MYRPKGIRRIVRLLGERHLSEKMYIFLFPFILRRMHKSRKDSQTHFSVVERGLFSAEDPDGTKIFFCERTRHEIYLFREGVKARLGKIMGKYSSDRVCVEAGDIVVDVGANIGEFSIAVSNVASRLIVIDPDPNVQKALKKNLQSFTHVSLVQTAMSNKVGEVEFFLSTKDADSSIVKPSSFNDIITVKADTLDNVLKSLGVERVNFLKVEAEGWEPEILEGGKSTLSMVRKIAVDAGPEREGLPTARSVISLLKESGFKVSERGHMIFGIREKY